MDNSSSSADNVSSSFKSAVLAMQTNLFSFALKLTLNREEARDLVQDTTLKALNNEDKFVEDSNFKGWILTIMRNIFINNYRRVNRENTVIDVSDDSFQINSTADSIQTPEGARTVTEISELLHGFPRDYREPFGLHMAGYKYEEISKMLSMPLGTVKSRIFFTRKRLREILKDYR